MIQQEKLFREKNIQLENQLAAQTRELEIQTSLEKIRQATMGMQRSDELKEVGLEMLQEMQNRGITAAVCFIIIMNEADFSLEFNMADSHTQRIALFKGKISENSVNRKMFDNWKRKSKSFIIDIHGEELDNYRLYLKQRGVQIHSESPANHSLFNMANFSKGIIGVASKEPLSFETMHLLERFAQLFDGTYTRFLDLKKAEAQSREAHIESGLERVRTRALAMHSSEELKEVVRTLFEELLHFDIDLQACLIATFDAVTFDQRCWMIHLKTNEPYTLLVGNNEQPFYVEMLKAWKERNANWTFMLEGETKNKWENFLFANTDFTLLPQPVKDGMRKREKVFFAASYYNYGAIQAAGSEPFSQQSIDILQRFSKAFDSCYTRFEDLQKAEAQAREAEIQLALERVRGRTMAMQKSDELQETTLVLFQQFKALGDTTAQVSICIFDEESIKGEVFVTLNGEEIDRSFQWELYKESFIMKKVMQAFLDKEKSFSVTIKGKELQQYNRWRNQLNEKKGWDESDAALNHAWHVNAVFFSRGMMGISSDNPPSDETINLLERFAAVFNQTYTRFLDLKKTEALEREAQIEAALERVRARAMAMQNSEELNALVGTVFTELTKLDMVLTRCVIMIYDPATKDARWLMANSETPDQPMNFLVKYHEYAPNLAYLNAWQKQTLKWEYVLEGTIKEEWDNFIFSKTELSLLPAFVIAGMKEPDRVYLNASFNSFGNVTLATLEPLSNEHADILLRFAKVFDLTYTRFNDLKQAEAQARESQIQLALERVRARTMAMQHSNELSETTAILFRQMNELGNSPERLNIGIIKEDKGFVETWATEQGGHQINHSFNARLDEPTTIAKLYKGWKTQRTSMVVDISGNELKQWIRFLKNELNMPVKEELLQDRRIQSVAYFKEGFILITTPEPLPVETISLLERFAEVFNLTYTRFLDLQKAEAQAKEAKIEAALERVRAKAMAMQNSQDLSDTIGRFYHELQSFSLTPIRCGVGLLDKEERIGELFTWYPSGQSENFELAGRLKLEGHPVLNKAYEKWSTQTEYHPVLRGNEIKEYYKILKPQLAFPDYTHDDVRFGNFFPFPEGSMYAWTEKELQQDELQIYRRFTSVLSLTYKRYRDLEKAEASAKEVQKQSALDRIRADIASMRSISDLDRITPLIWNELTILGVPFIRCGVFIMDDEVQKIHTFLSTPEGKGIAAFHLPYDTPGNISHVISHWFKKEIYTDHWDEEAFKEFANSLVQQGAMESTGQYLSTMPAGGFDLHFVPFQQGMLYVGNTAPLGEEEINLLQSLANAFSTAYARYEDFNKLEAAKKKVDKTLVELKQTQQQLVQSEKMASLGELTAGIAHEIQNPLNFVNNFSEVNKEILEELKAERLKPKAERDDNLQDELINEVITNEEKINHHGKRADAIVKGMLQHSRKSSGQKEPTDINALADEYLRLGYHGLRAKDKNFNSIIKTDFDNSIGKINIIPQDIGRVLLNLFNNAFYAVNEQKTRNFISYEPMVSVTTKKSENRISITVSDNGNGIPQKILDKIFQPFFTTKPTGQGTGLGLSLSYDIVKAHGGELKVNSKEGEGSEFVIHLAV